MVSERTTRQRLEELKSYGFYLAPQRVHESSAEGPITEGCAEPIEFFPDGEYEMVITKGRIREALYDHLMDRWNRSTSTPLGSERHPLLRYFEGKTTAEVIEQLAKPLAEGESSREVEVGEGVIKVFKEGVGINYELDLQPHRIIVGKGRLGQRFSSKITIYDFLLPHSKYLKQNGQKDN